MPDAATRAPTSTRPAETGVLTTGVQLPAVRSRRERIASPTETAQLIAALPSKIGQAGRPRHAGLRSGAKRSVTSSSTSTSPDTRPVELGPKGRSRRTQEPRRPPHGPPSARASAFTSASAGWPAAGMAGSSSAIRTTSHSRTRPSASGLSVAAGCGRRANRPTRLPRPTSASLVISAGCEREGPLGLHGTRHDHQDPGPLRAPVSGSEDEAAGLFDAYLERATQGAWR